MKVCPECNELISTEEEVDYWNSISKMCVGCTTRRLTDIKLLIRRQSKMLSHTKAEQKKNKSRAQKQTDLSNMTDVDSLFEEAAKRQKQRAAEKSKKKSK